MDSDVEEGEIPDELNPGTEPARGERAAPEHSNAVRDAVNLVHACTMTPERCHIRSRLPWLKLRVAPARCSSKSPVTWLAASHG
jgi:hypothetical protein